MEPIKALNLASNMILIVSLIAITQYFNLMNLNQLYVSKIAPTQHITLISNHITPRVIGLSGNPNTFSFIAATGCVINMYIYLFHKSNVKYLLKMLVTFIALMMTFSRTGLIVMVIMIFVLLINKLKSYQFLSYIRVAFLCLGSILFFLFLLPHELKLRLINFSVFGDSSFQARYDSWQVALYYINDSPFFGVGTTKSILDFPTIDNEWLMLLKTYGIVGTIILSLMFLVVFLGIKENSLKVFYFAIVVGTFLFMIPSSVYNTFQLMSVIIILGCVSCKKY